jgi:pyrophosphatase PpaX
LTHGVRYRAVLFDFDGTLAPSLPLWIRSYQWTLRHYQLEFSEAQVLQHCFFRDFGDIVSEFGLGSTELFQARIHEGLALSFLQAELFPLARPLVEHCRRHGQLTALVTSSPREIVDGVLTRLDLHALFDFTICGGEVENYKPHPQPVIRALTALDCAAGEAIMVGDSHADILSGRAAGTRTALYLPDDHHRFHDIDRLRATQPDHVFADHAELPALLGLPALPAH